MVRTRTAATDSEIMKAYDALLDALYGTDSKELSEAQKHDLGVYTKKYLFEALGRLGVSFQKQAMTKGKVKEALKAAASFKARGIKKAALDVVAGFERKQAGLCPARDESGEYCILDFKHVQDGGPHSTQGGHQWNTGEPEEFSVQAAPGDEPIQRDQPAAQADPAIPDPTVQPAAPVSPAESVAEEPEEIEEAEETEEGKIARWREELDTELNSDDDLVTAVLEFLEAEKLDYDDYSVDVTDNSDGTATVAGYIIAPNDDVPENMALAQVRSDLESEPELFNQDWLQGHINEERLRNDLSSDVENMALESVRESPDSYGWDADDVYETDAEGNYIDGEGNIVDDPDTPSDEWIESKAEEIAASQLRDPVAYMQEIYGDADGIKQAIEFAGIDINAAAEEAVAADGWQHFLSRYDGNSYDLPSGGVYWKE